MNSIKQKPIDVSIRIKPFIQNSTSTSYFSCPQSIEEWIVEQSQPFAANVWKVDHTQAKIFDDFMNKQFLPSFRAGLNFTCFLYGQTG